MKTKKPGRKRAVVGILVSVFIVAVVCLLFIESSSNVDDLEQNYKENSEGFADLVRYMRSVEPENKTVYLEFTKKDELSFHIRDSLSRSNNWDLPLYSYKTDSLLREIGWSREMLKTLQRKLESVNCISIRSGEPCEIGFVRRGFGMYFYRLFTQPLSALQKQEYNDSCNYILYSDQIVFEYQGGAIGAQCFPEFR